MTETTKVHFRLKKDEDDYPPDEVESAWARPVGEKNEYVLDNIPFFTRDATYGDTIATRLIDGELWFQGLVRSSGNSLLRVLFFDLGLFDLVCARVKQLGCDVEFMEGYKILSVSVPPSSSLDDVIAFLEQEAGDDTIDYEEAILR